MLVHVLISLYLYIQISEYRLVIQASDSGTPRQSSTVLLIITITDINDNAPVFSQTNYTAQVQVTKHTAPTE